MVLRRSTNHLDTKMRGLVQRYLGRIDLRHIWIFITDKCNLNCDYCFFSGKKARYRLSRNQISVLFSALPKLKALDFIISGGEPLLFWRKTKDLIERIRSDFGRGSITLQSNCLLLSLQKIKYLRSSGVVIEPGIDGGFQANYKHRKGITRENFRSFLDNLKLISEHGCRMNPTMTVHPDETAGMFDNFRALLSLGLHSIDIHPAFLAAWNKTAANSFLREYKKIIFFEKASHRYLVCKNYSVPIKPSLDLVIQPNGAVLPNWVFLAFPYFVRNEFFIMRLGENKIKIFNDNLSRYMKNLCNFFVKEKSYRDFSNFNAACALKIAGDNRLRKLFLAYKALTEDIQKIDRIFLRKEDLL